jgi:hypothetical protein
MNANKEHDMTETTPVTADTDVSEIAAYLRDKDVEHTQTPDGMLKCQLDDGRRLNIYQHPESDGADIAGLWAYNVVGDCSDGLDKMEDIAWLIS